MCHANKASTGVMRLGVVAPTSAVLRWPMGRWEPCHPDLETVAPRLARVNRVDIHNEAVVRVHLVVATVTNMLFIHGSHEIHVFRKCLDDIPLNAIILELAELSR
jgi:hypothetical protein